MEIYGKGFIAPLSNFTNAPMRKMLKKYGADYSVVPLISATALVRKPEDMLKKVDYNPKFDDGIQLFGSVPEDFKGAIVILLDNFPELKWIDINCGCPSYIVREAGAGSALLENPKRLKEILERIEGIADVLSIKVRLLKEREKTPEFLKEYERYVDFITVHGRTAPQGYSGKADWDMIKKIREHLEVPIVGNGDLQSKSEGLKRIKEGYSDGYMIGRRAISNPWAFDDREPKGIEDSIRFLREYIEIAENLGEARLVDVKLKALQFFHGFPHSAQWRKKLATAKSIEDFKRVIEENL